MNTINQFSLAVAAIALTVGSATAQVDNGDFSNATKAPRTFNQLNLANGWSNGNGGTTDFYHNNSKKCSNMGTASNRLGEQAPFKGDGYAGIIAYQNDKSSGFSIQDMAVVETEGYGKYSEYITTKLNKALTAGQSYKVTYYVSLAENSGYAVSGFGASLTSESVNQKSNAYIMTTPQVVTSNVVDSKSKWTKIEGTFTAKGGEQYLTIGVFNEPASSKAVGGGNGVNSIRAYYFVDGVSVGAGVPEKDSDNDGLSDAMEASIGTNPNNPDTDNDGYNDGEEITGIDDSSTSDFEATFKSDPMDDCDPSTEGGNCDADGDGLTNDEESKLGTSPDMADSDGDGVNDGEDACPTIAGDDKGCPKVDNSGPDSDKDGLSDAMEAKIGTNPNNPDSDGDGLNDGEEFLGADSPSTSANASGKSNPKDACDPFTSGKDCDPDGDGLTNAVEAKLGTDGNNPDTDGDSVNDKADHCPTVAGTVAAAGCALDEELLAQIKSASEHIYFNSGKSTIKGESYPDLNKLAEIFKAHPEVKASIEGHTDSQGNDQMNLNLSKARAKAVKDYLINKGVDADHLASEGYGETQPVADNGTAAGRAKNRRVIVQTTMYKAK
ncbi:MAG: OmpA family protein [Crocinitomicaceae bacterium]|nr:OmpA family protein [Crocinitomicaceae bacterium]